MKAEYYSHYGSDNMVADAARVSFSKEASNYTEEKNAKLIRYLARNNHVTPFFHPQVTLRMQAPVPIRTQCFKSKIGFAENEESRRYIKSEPRFYVPETFRSAPEGNIKQGSGETHSNNGYWKREYYEYCNKGMMLYKQMIEDNVCPEQARFVLPQGTEVEWFWTGSLAAYARFFNLRNDSHAQKEVQILSEQVGRIVSELFPISWKYLTEG